MEAKFTKGPWFVVGPEPDNRNHKGGACRGISTFQKYRSDRMIVETDSGVYQPSLLDAYLIAAAPEMYQMIENLLDNIIDCQDPAVKEDAEIILAKARGE
jgi:hypothetical protein